MIFFVKKHENLYASIITVCCSFCMLLLIVRDHRLLIHVMPYCAARKYGHWLIYLHMLFQMTLLQSALQIIMKSWMPYKILCIPEQHYLWWCPGTNILLALSTKSSFQTGFIFRMKTLHILVKASQSLLHWLIRNALDHGVRFVLCIFVTSIAKSFVSNISLIIWSVLISLSACPVCYVSVDQAFALIPLQASPSPVLKNLNYVSEDSVPANLSSRGSLFGGLPSLEQRNKSFDISESMSVHCG
jgi:hypothetical protein